jgi:Fe-S-cluster containining protein
MGTVYRIVEEKGNREFLIVNVYTGENYEVRIDPDKIHLFEHRVEAHITPDACPFLYPARGDEDAACTVHHSRPDVCREVFCCRLLIVDGEGRRVGRIMGTRHLCPETPQLEELWENRVRTLKVTDDATWEEKVIAILMEAGYFIRG